jgi:hypothetical protein
MGILGFAIVISIIIALVFGWDFMMEMWSDIFNYIREFAGVILDKAKDDGHGLLP